MWPHPPTRSQTTAFVALQGATVPNETPRSYVKVRVAEKSGAHIKHKRDSLSVCSSCARLLRFLSLRAMYATCMSHCKRYRIISYCWETGLKAWIWKLHLLHERRIFSVLVGKTAFLDAPQRGSKNMQYKEALYGTWFILFWMVKSKKNIQTVRFNIQESLRCTL